MIVVDTNVLAYLYLPSEYSSAAEALLDADPDWAAPVLWRSEFRNLLTGYLRRGALTFDQALAVQSEAEHQMSGMEYEVDTQLVMKLAHESDCSAYDCEFAALATTLGTRLITLDKKLLRAFPQIAGPLVAT